MRYLIFYKPYGVLAQFTPEPGSQHRTLADYIDVPNVYAAGRLDGDSEGLLFLTDDGKLKHRLLDPEFGHQRTYWVQVEGVPTEAALQQLRNGVIIQGRKTRPAQAILMEAPSALPPRDPPIRFRAQIPTAWIALTLTEGRNRQVRRMTAAVGYPTLRLVRWSMEDLSIAGLAPGQWRDLTPRELSRFRRRIVH